MIRCFVTATSSSQEFLMDDNLTAQSILRQSIKEGPRSETHVELVENPDDADIILFAESHRNNDAIRHVLRHPLYIEFPSKCVVHCGMDRPEPLVPGLYPSIDRRWTRRLSCAGSPYLVPLNPFIGTIEPETCSVDLLASFMGSCRGKRVRLNLLQTAVRDSWTDILVKDSGAEFVRSIRGGDLEAHLALKRTFAEDLLRSRFVLCPAGAGPSSFRIFEAMKSSRAPVVIADGWTPPPGPDWDSFLVRVAEADIERLPQILKAESDTWEEKGRLARMAWERYCDPENFGSDIVMSAASVLAGANTRPIRRRMAAWVYMNVFHRAGTLRLRLAGKARKYLGTAGPGGG